MGDRRSMIWLAVGLVALSALVYATLYATFGRGEDVLFYLIHALGLVPLQILLISLIVDGLLSARERQALLKKLNMVIGAFFSEVGTELARDFAAMDGDVAELRDRLGVANDWSKAHFAETLAWLSTRDPDVSVTPAGLEELKTLLVARRGFLLALLENPNLLEHESFTDLLWAVFHLTEELANRPDLSTSSGADLAHLTVDVKRAYAALVSQWVRYMQHLRADYPYLFSLAVRTNPFDPEATVRLG